MLYKTYTKLCLFTSLHFAKTNNNAFLEQVRMHPIHTQHNRTHIHTHTHTQMHRRMRMFILQGDQYINILKIV